MNFSNSTTNPSIGSFGSFAANNTTQQNTAHSMFEWNSTLTTAVAAFSIAFVAALAIKILLKVKSNASKNTPTNAPTMVEREQFNLVFDTIDEHARTSVL